MTESLGRYDDPLAAPYITSLRTRVDGAKAIIYFLYGGGSDGPWEEEGHKRHKGV